MCLIVYDIGQGVHYLDGKCIETGDADVNTCDCESLLWIEASRRALLAWMENEDGEQKETT